MLRTIFCLCPSGTGWGMRVYHVLVLGCVPVLFHVGQLQQWCWHWGEWAANATVLLNLTAVLAGELDVVAELRRTCGTPPPVHAPNVK